jgi:hypothetical protein
MRRKMPQGPRIEVFLLADVASLRGGWPSGLAPARLMGPLGG